MARPQKNKVEYFPHPVTHGKKMSYMEKKYGNDGYAVWFKILEELGNTDFHYLNLKDEIQIMFLSDRCLVSEERLLEIINDLIKLKEFDRVLWSENKIIFSTKYIESIKDAYLKRTNECINEKSILLLLDSLGVRKLPKSKPKPIKSKSEVAVKPQTKLEETKPNKTKLEESIFYRKFAHLKLEQKEFEELQKIYPKEKIDTTLDKIENYKKNKNYKSLYLTLKNWLKSDFEKEKNVAPKKEKRNAGKIIAEKYGFSST